MTRGPAVALGGVGLPAFAALPLIDEFAARGIAPRAVAASGFGCLVAAFWGCGIDTEGAIKRLHRGVTPGLFRRSGVGAAMALLGFGPGARRGVSGLWPASPFRRLLGDWFGELRLEDLRFPVTVCLTDLHTAELVCASSGPLAELVYAGCAHFPLMAPASFDGRTVCDGSYLHPAPVVVAAASPGPVLGVHASVAIPHGRRRIESLHQHVFGSFSRYLARLHHEVVAGERGGRVCEWHVEVAQRADPWHPATVGLAVAAGREAVARRAADLGSLLELAA